MNLRFLAGPLLLCAFFPSAPYATPLDSLRMAWTQSETPDERLAAGRELLTYYGRRGHDSTLVFSTAVQQLARELHDHDALAEAFIAEGLFLHNRSQHEDALHRFQQALDLAARYGLDHQLGHIYHNMGLSYRRGFRQDSAFYYFAAAEKAFRETGQISELWRPGWGMSQIYQENGEIEPAVDYGLRAVKTLESSGSRAEYGYVLYNFYSYLFKNERYQDLAELQQHRAAFLEDDRPSQEVLEMPEHLALYRFLVEDDASLGDRLQDAIIHYDSLGNAFSKGWCQEDLGDYYREQNEWEAARNVYQQALDNFRAAGAVYRQGRTLYHLIEVTRQQADYPAAFFYLENYKNLADSLRNAEMTKNLQQLQVEYETAQKERDLRIKELELRQSTQQRNILLIGSIGLILLSVGGGWSLRARLRQDKALARQEQALRDERIRQLEQEKKLAALGAMVEGQEKERIRIAKDLHDGLGGLLTSIKAHFSNFQPHTTDAVYDKTNALIDQACVDVRRIAHNMMPSALLLSGLRGALEDLADQLRQGGLACRLEVMHLPNDLPAPRAMTIYRILQELTNNIRKHAGAQRVLIQLLAHQGMLSILVEDDGQGFDPDLARKQPTVGLKSIESRVRYLRGEWSLDSVAGEGTTVTINLPLVASE